MAAPRYWEVGDEDRDWRFNNYLGRFHWRHVDLMDVLSGYGASHRVGLGTLSEIPVREHSIAIGEIAVLLGFPGKLGMSGAHVWDAYLEGRIGDIRDYCETDVLNTWLVYLRFQRMRGRLTADGLTAEETRVADYLRAESRPHFKAFLEAWGRA